MKNHFSVGARIVSLVLCLLLTVTCCPVVLADDTPDYRSGSLQCYIEDYDSYYTFPVLYNDDTLLVDGAEFASAFGFKSNLKEDGSFCMVAALGTEAQKEYGFLIFFFYQDKKQITAERSYINLDYSVPVACYYDGETAWIPFAEAVLLLERDLTIEGNCAVISPRYDSFLNYANQLQYQRTSYIFSLDELYGESTATVAMCSCFANFWQDVLSTCGVSYLSGNTYANAKYADKYCDLNGTYADEELQTQSESLETLNDAIEDIGESAENVQQAYAMNYDDLCQEIRKGLKNTPGFAESHKGQQLLNALNINIRTEAIANTVTDIESDLEGATDTLSVLGDILTALSYVDTFQSRDVFAVDAMDYFLKHENNLLINDSTGAIAALQVENDLLQTNVGTYGVIHFIAGKGADEIVDTVTNTVAGTQGGLVLLAWNLASNYIPCIKTGLSVSDNTELAMYGNVMEVSFDSYTDSYTDIHGMLIDGTDNLYRFAQAYYLYFKSCYITRSTGLQTMRDRGFNEYSTEEGVAALYKEEEALLEETAELAAFFGGATADLSDSNFYGRLPDYMPEIDLTAFIALASGSAPANTAADADQSAEAQSNQTSAQNSLREILVDYLGSDTIVDFCEADYDKDGTNEAFALANVSDGAGTVYYVTYSGVTPTLESHVFSVYEEGRNLIDFSDAAFYVIGEFSATSSPSYVFGVQNGAWYLSDISLYGSSLSQTAGTNELTYTQDAYDACADGTGHTWKPYYLYWDGSFKEYGGIEITEEELLRCDGASEILNTIIGAGSHIDSIFYRSNGIINVNFSDDFSMHYATLQLTGTTVTLCCEAWDTTGSGVYSGVYADALIPAIAVYPSEFPVEGSADASQSDVTAAEPVDASQSDVTEAEPADDSEDALLTWSDFHQIIQEASLYAWNWYWDPSQYLSTTDTIPDTEGLTYNGVYSAVTVDGIHSMEDLREQSHQYFSYAAIADMESHLFYKEQDGKLYIGLMGGLGDVPVSEIYYDGCRLDKATYRLDLSEGYTTGDSRKWSIYYIKEDGDWVFDSPIEYLGINPLPFFEGGNGSFITDCS